MWTSTEKLVAVLFFVVVAELIGFGLWTGVRVTEADRRYRSDAVEACMTIEDESRRSECIKEVG